MAIKKAAIIAGRRIPFARSMGKYMGIGNQDLLTASVKALVEDCKLKGEELGEVVLGAVLNHSADWNIAREVAIGSGLSLTTPAYNVQQACGTSLEAAILVANKIALGQIDSGIAGGSDTNSDLPIVFSKNFRHQLQNSFSARKPIDKLKPWMSIRPRDLAPVIPAVVEPRTNLSMGQSCELMVKEWKVTRDEQDEIAYHSHQNAVAAYEEGFYQDLVVPFQGVDKDNNVRPNTSKERLAKLRPAFDRSEAGTMTAGNSTPLTDGAAAVLLGSEEWAKARGLPIQAYITHSQSAAVDFIGSEGLLMAPAYAVAKMLKTAGLGLQDFDFYEIHEAFAGQVLCTLKAWESEKFCKDRLGLDKALGSIDRSKLNVKGGSVALGHPFGATGARLIGNLAKLLEQKGSGRGLISVCTGGGMGITAILER